MLPVMMNIKIIVIIAIPNNNGNDKKKIMKVIKGMPV